VLLVFAVTFASAQEGKIPKQLQEELTKLYQQAAEYMRRSSPLFAEKATNSNANFRIRSFQGTGKPRSLEMFRDLNRDLYMEVWADSLRVIRVNNQAMSNKYNSREARNHPPEEQKTPSLTETEAIERAKNYMRVFGMEVPPCFRLKGAKFNYAGFTFRWSVSWGRFSGQYPWDGEYMPSDHACVVFHEKYGLSSIANVCCCPEPKTLNVKLSKEQAITKAEKCVPLVQRTSFYRSRLLDGFVSKAIRSCELKVAAPNWLLDPKRAVWIRKGPPEETRLCWVVQFETVDVKAQERKGSLYSPSIVIYIDAATGETVGAVF
jgi:hypothetical protein